MLVQKRCSHNFGFVLAALVVIAAVGFGGAQTYAVPVCGGSAAGGATVGCLDAGQDATIQVFFGPSLADNQTWNSGTTVKVFLDCANLTTECTGTGGCVQQSGILQYLGDSTLTALTCTGGQTATIISNFPTGSTTADVITFTLSSQVVLAPMQQCSFTFGVHIASVEPDTSPDLIQGTVLVPDATCSPTGTGAAGCGSYFVTLAPKCTISPSAICANAVAPNNQLCIVPKFNGGTVDPNPDADFTYAWTASDPGGLCPGEAGFPAIIATTRCITLPLTAGTYFGTAVETLTGCCTTCSGTVIAPPTCSVSPNTVCAAASGPTTVSPLNVSITGGVVDFWEVVTQPAGCTVTVNSTTGQATFPAGCTGTAGLRLHVKTNTTPVCTGSCDVNVTVLPNPTCSATYTSVCASQSTDCPRIPEATTVSPSNVNTDGGVVDFWELITQPTGCTVTINTATGAVTFPAGCSGTATVRLHVKTTTTPVCTGSCDTTVTVNPNPTCATPFNFETAFQVTGTIAGGTPPYTCSATVTGTGFSIVGCSVSGQTFTVTYSTTPPVANNATFTVTITDSHGCTGCCTETLSCLCSCTASGETVICLPNGTALLSVVPSGFPVAPVTFAWTGPSGFVPFSGQCESLTSCTAGQFTATVPGIYTVTLTDGIGQTSPACCQPVVGLSISGPTTVCPGAQGLTYTANVDTGSNGGTFTATSYIWTVSGATFCDGTTCTTVTSGNTVCVNAGTSASFTLGVRISGSESFSCAGTTLLGLIEGPGAAQSCPNVSQVCTFTVTTAGPRCVTPNPSSGPPGTQFCASATGGNPGAQGTVLTACNCSGQTLTLESSGYAFCWTGPGGFVATTSCITPTAAGEYTVTVFDADCCASTNVCAVTVVPPPTGCRFTGGGNADGTYPPWASGQEKKAQSGLVDFFTFGGQAGAPLTSCCNPDAPDDTQPWGEWTHQQQSGPDGDFTFHAGTASAPPGTLITCIECCDPPACNHAAANGHFKQLDFSGIGTLKNFRKVPASWPTGVPFDKKHFYAFEVHIEDLGEPGAGGHPQPPTPGVCPEAGFLGSPADCSCPDFYRIKIHTTCDFTSDVGYEVFCYIRGGNFQIHDPTGSHKKSLCNDTPLPADCPDIQTPPLMPCAAGGGDGGGLLAAAPAQEQPAAPATTPAQEPVAAPIVNAPSTCGSVAAASMLPLMVVAGWVVIRRRKTGR